jgi:cytochrome c oxidase subunit IV
MSTKSDPQKHSARYGVTWAALLGLTVVMLVVDSSPLPRLAFVLILLSAMLAKATLIGANFMHLRFERPSLAVIVVIGLLITAALLFGLIVPDALRIRDMVSYR